MMFDQTNQTTDDKAGGPPAMLANVTDDFVRQGFIRKVYGILSVQLVFTFLVALPIQQADHAWIIQNRPLCQFAMILSIGLVLGVSCCCQDAMRNFPTNYGILFLVTLCQAVIVGFVSNMYTAESVALAVALTAGIFFGLTVFAMTTSIDTTGFGHYLAAAVWGLFLTSLLCMFFPYSPMMQKIFAGAGAIIFSMYIVYDTQLIVGGKHTKHRFAIDDYCFAALNIYLDIIHLFLYLLQLFGQRDGR